MTNNIPVETLQVEVTKEQAQIIEQIKSEGKTVNQLLDAIFAAQRNGIPLEYGRPLTLMPYTDILKAFEFGYRIKKTREEKTFDLHTYYHDLAQSKDYEMQQEGNTGLEVIEKMIEIWGLKIRGLEEI